MEIEKKHSNGEVWEGLFIVGVSIPNVGDYSYHYHTEYWGEFDIPELAFAPEYDGHTPADIDRLFELIPFEDKFISDLEDQISELHYKISTLEDFIRVNCT